MAECYIFGEWLMEYVKVDIKMPLLVVLISLELIDLSRLQSLSVFKLTAGTAVRGGKS